eukprot:TRINITY_DN1313_c0_g1_i2.p1 TRINITY_DN1313_c0_g1~~TRINITY_DN1313_c0_g1_i2.p1  ORF type:complete len:143 (-),score=10.22 TRINITY_DN1313_c0_g1_i2:118-546(-)
MLEIVLVVGLSVMAFLLALLILPFVPRRISSFLVSLSHNISPVVRVVLIMLWLALLVKTFDSYKTMVKYEHQRHEKMAEISAKRDVLLHKFRAERNLYIECFAVVVTMYVMILVEFNLTLVFSGRQVVFCRGSGHCWMHCRI